MVSGGSRARSGPPPNPVSQRSLDRDWIVLSADPGIKVLPAWPYPPALPAELAQWTRLWKLPQARVWQDSHLHAQVAQYVRALVASVATDAGPSMKQTVLRMEDELGISLSGMLKHGWKHEATSIPKSRTSPKAKTAPAKRQTASGNWLQGVTVRDGS